MTKTAVATRGRKYRVLVTGSRRLYSPVIVYRALDAELEKAMGAGYDELVVVHGGCPTGADKFASDWGWYKFAFDGAPVLEERHAADWETYGKGAGPKRNEEMVQSGVEVCLAFFKNGAENRGTQDCVDRASEYGLTVRRFEE